MCMVRRVSQLRLHLRLGVCPSFLVWFRSGPVCIESQPLQMRRWWWSWLQTSTTPHCFSARLSFFVYIYIYKHPVLEQGKTLTEGISSIFRCEIQEVAPANQTKERAKTKSSWISTIFVNSGVFLRKTRHDSHWTFVLECPCEKFMNWPFFGMVCRGHSWEIPLSFEP